MEQKTPPGDHWKTTKIIHQFHQLFGSLESSDDYLGRANLTINPYIQSNN